MRSIRLVEAPGASALRREEARSPGAECLTTGLLWLQNRPRVRGQRRGERFGQIARTASACAAAGERGAVGQSEAEEGARAARKGVEGRTKTRKRRRVYLCAPAVRALREQLMARRPTEHGLVFPSPRSDNAWNSDNFRADVFAKAVKRAAAKARPARRADFARLEFHDLRHTFASLMIAAGANPLQLAEALGHSDGKGRPDPTLVWKRYGHLYPGSAREAAAALNRHLSLEGHRMLNSSIVKKRIRRASIRSTTIAGMSC